MVERDPSVLVVGAGPTGLVLALWLARRGVRVRIIDRAAEAGTTSRALAVQARTLEFYRQMGIADAVIAAGVKVSVINLWVRGRRAAKVPIGRIGEGLSAYPYALIFPQDAHERLLIGELERAGVRVERSTELVEFEEHAGGVHARLRRGDGTEEACDAAYLAGCDGAGSTVRRALGIGFPGGTYTGLFYVADVEATGPATNMELHGDIEDADFQIVFPMRRPGTVRLVGIAKEKEGGGPIEFSDVRGRATEQLRLGVTGVNWFSTYRVHHRVADRFRAGRVFLLGDAGHIHSPVGGQGMNTGIGDAVNLGWKIAAVVKGGGPEALLDSYEPERMAFARRLVATTDRAFTVITSPTGRARFVRIRLVPRVAPIAFRVPCVRRFMFRTLSQTGVAYHESALSRGSAGRVRAGDRLPWVMTGRDEDNFAPLSSMAWQVHVYGEASDEVRRGCAERGWALHEFAWRGAYARAGFARGAAYVIRPDGYVAGADASRLMADHLPSA